MCPSWLDEWSGWLVKRLALEGCSRPPQHADAARASLSAPPTPRRPRWRRPRRTCLPPCTCHRRCARTPLAGIPVSGEGAGRGARSRVCCCRPAGEGAQRPPRQAVASHPACALLQPSAFICRVGQGVGVVRPGALQLVSSRWPLNTCETPPTRSPIPPLLDNSSADPINTPSFSTHLATRRLLCDRCWASSLQPRMHAPPLLPTPPSSLSEPL